MSRRVPFAVFVLMLVLMSLTACSRTATTESKYSLGLKLATAEQLQKIPLASIPFSGQMLPPSVDLSKDMPPPGQQGKQQSCVGWAVAYALKSYQERLEERYSLVDTSGRADPSHVYSPAFIYNQINNGLDGGSYIIDALNLVWNQGAAPWADMPYSEADYTQRPSDTAKARAQRYRIAEWRKIDPHELPELKAQLNAGYPIIIGITVDEGFLSAKPGFIWSADVGQKIGAHAAVLVGYDDQRRAFKLINSFGVGWGDGGYGWVTYEHFSRVVNEAYIAKDGVNGPSNETVPPVQPLNPPQVAFMITNWGPVQDPERPELGWFLRFDGSLQVPAGIGRAAQVVIHFYYDAGGGQKGAPVRSLLSQFSTIYGDAATGTESYNIPPDGLSVNWAAWIPYTALDVPSGQWVSTPQGQVYQPAITALVAEPTLFVDNFGIRSGGLFPFTVQY